MTHPASSDVAASIPRIVIAAQAVYDAWEQDADGMDEELGTGGICDGVADAMVAVLMEDMPDLDVATQYIEADTHTVVIARFADGVFRIDIPPHVYEVGFGYVWSKRPDVTITGDDVTVTQLSPDPERFHEFLD